MAGSKARDVHRYRTIPILDCRARLLFLLLGQVRDDICVYLYLYVDIDIDIDMYVCNIIIDYIL